MADAYTVFWTRERCVTLRRLGWTGRPLETLFGGPHTSEPSFSRAGVRPGDQLYPIAVRAGVLYVCGRARVRRLLTLEDYVQQQADLASSLPPSYHARRSTVTQLRADPLVASCQENVPRGGLFSCDFAHAPLVKRCLVQQAGSLYTRE